MRVLITGSSGQIGTNLGLRLLQDGHELVGLDNRSNSWTDAIPTHLLNLAQSQHVAPGRLGEVEVGQVDLVVHLAAHAKVHALVERPLGALENHVMVTNALEFARLNRTRHGRCTAMPWRAARRCPRAQPISAARLAPTRR
jgi:UDP-glucose 4-epimerase